MKIIVTLFGIILFGSVFVHADPPVITRQVTPGAMSYQGRLQTPDGVDYTNGVYTVDFKLYDAISGGTFLWGATYKPYVNNGFFSVILGQTGVGEEPVDGALYPDAGDFWKGVWIDPNGADKERFLGITVHEDADNQTLASYKESFPRQQLLASPFAIQSQFAQQASHADNADNATYAANTANSTNATHAVNADNATHAMNADIAIHADNADGSTAGFGVGGDLSVTGSLTVVGSIIQKGAPDDKYVVASKSNNIRVEYAEITAAGEVTQYSSEGIGSAGREVINGYYVYTITFDSFADAPVVTATPVFYQTLGSADVSVVGIYALEKDFVKIFTSGIEGGSLPIPFTIMVTGKD